LFASLPRSVVGLEACGSAHHWARELINLGHGARMMPPAYVKPYIRRQKTDAVDAAAICEAATRPSMRFVAVRSLENQATLMRHKVREMLVSQRTQLLNGLRGHLAEVGVIAPQGPRHARELADRIEACEETIPTEVCEALAPLVVQLRSLDEAIARLERTIAKLAQQDETARRLMSIPSFGPITASAMLASVQDVSSFSGPREFAASLGLTPKQNSSGGKTRLGRISKMGQPGVAQIARRRGACRTVPSQASHGSPAPVGQETYRKETFQACRRGARQQDGANRLRNPARQDGRSRSPA
jgi:transposase